jgi:hypothetical protein
MTLAFLSRGSSDSQLMIYMGTVPVSESRIGLKFRVVVHKNGVKANDIGSDDSIIEAQFKCLVELVKGDVVHSIHKSMKGRWCGEFREGK